MSKTTRIAISNDQKREIHLFKKDNPKAKNDEIFSWIVIKRLVMTDLVSPNIRFIVNQFEQKTQCLKLI